MSIADPSAPQGDADTRLKALVSRSLEAAGEGRLEEARAATVEALTLAPGHAGLIGNLATITLQLGDAREAERLFAEAHALEPANPAPLLGVASLALQREDLDAAAGWLGKAIDADPFHVQSRILLAQVLRRQGATEAAAAQLRDAMDMAPDLPDLRIELSALHETNGDRDAALAVLEVEGEAAGDVRVLQQRAGLLIGLRRLDEATALLAAIEQALPGQVMTAYYRGLAAQAAEDWEAAERHFAAASAGAPDDAQFINVHATALQRLGRQEEAIALLLRARALAPGLADIPNNLANGYSALERREEAVACYREALALKPEPLVWCNLGNVLRAMGRLTESEAAFLEALALAPDMPNIRNGLGLTYQQQNRHEDALVEFRRATELSPDYVEALNNQAISLAGLNRFSEAVEAYNRLLDLKPDLPEALFNLGTLLQQLNRWDESIVVMMQAITVRPDYATVYPHLAHAMMQQCSWTNLDATVQRIRENTEAELAAGRPASVSCFGLQSLPGDFPMALRRQVAERVADQAAGYVHQLRDRTGPPPARTGRPGRKLRIGYLSPDFRFHSVAVAFRGILQHHDRQDFELFGYSLSARHDEMTAWFAQQFDGFAMIAEAPFEAAVRRIRDDEIDILIDLAGHTRGSRMELLALRPAPLQAHYLGYSATTGARYLDYLITDPRQAPLEQRPHFTEKLVYLPDVFMATQRAEVSPRTITRAECGLPEDGIVFANFNTHYKFEPRMFAIWMRLLKRLPGSVLWVLAGTEASRRNLRAEAERRGVSAERIVFAEKLPHDQHLRRQQLADLALDNLYHGGGVTTVDALWIGLPVLTVTGDTPQSRNGASLNFAIGMQELTTSSLAEYERLALALARDPGRLAALRRRLVDNREREPLFRPERLTRHLEEAYRMMWARHEAGLAPDVIEVPSLPEPLG